MKRGDLLFRCLRCNAEFVGWAVTDLSIALASLVTIGRTVDDFPARLKTVHTCGEGKFGVAELIGGNSAKAD